MKLTDRIQASGASLTDLIHIVITSDTTQNSAGSSYKIPMSEYAALFGATSEYFTSGSTWNGTNYPIKTNNDSGLDATGAYSFAEGYQTTASGDISHAEGNGTIASNNNSHAEGNGTTASGVASHAEGSSTIAFGTASHAEGIGSRASGGYSHAEGDETKAGWKGFTITGITSGLISLDGTYGDVTSEFAGSTVILDGYIYTYNTVTFSSATSTEILLNNTTINSGNYVADVTNLNSSFADITLGQKTHAEGHGARALGIASHAENHFTIASGAYSHAEGEETTASGDGSHAEGYFSVAGGVASHAARGGARAGIA
jgi:hypothetical protein